MAEPELARKLGRPIPVRTVAVEQKEVRKVIGATCLTVPSKTSAILTAASLMIGPAGSGNRPVGLVVKQVLVKHGDLVRAGQVLVELDNANYLSTLQEWKALHAAAVQEVEYRERALEMFPSIRKVNVARAEAEVQYRTVDLNTRTKIRDALHSLSETGAASLISFYEALSTLSQAEFNLAAAKLDLLRIETEVTIGLLQNRFDLAAAIGRREQAAVGQDLVRWSSEACRLRSPLNGFVDVVSVVPGSVIDPATALMQVFQIDPIWINMDFPQERIGELTLGQEAEVVLDSFPRETFKGKVVAVMPQVNSQLRILPVYIEVSNLDCRIKASVSGFARLSVVQSVATVPAAAVIQDQHRAMVFCVRDGRARIRQIQTGHIVETGVLELRGGLAAGDEVVVFGNVDLRDGDPVDTDWRKWARRE